MINSELIPENHRKDLEHSVEVLQRKFHGVFGRETIESLLVDSYLQRAAVASVPNWLVLGSEVLTRDRLEALVHSADHSTTRTPAVLFLCVHNAARSQMALGWFHHLAGDRAVAWSAGSHPASEINPSAVAAMAEVGIDISGGFPEPWTDEVVDAADVVVTMGCGDTCPLVPGKRYEDWAIEITDSPHLPLSEIRPIRDEIGRRVRDLLARLEIVVPG